MENIWGPRAHDLQPQVSMEAIHGNGQYSHHQMVFLFFSLKTFKIFCVTCPCSVVSTWEFLLSQLLYILYMHHGSRTFCNWGGLPCKWGSPRDPTLHSSPLLSSSTFYHYRSHFLLSINLSELNFPRHFFFICSLPHKVKNLLKFLPLTIFPRDIKKDWKWGLCSKMFSWAPVVYELRWPYTLLAMAPIFIQILILL